MNKNEMLELKLFFYKKTYFIFAGRNLSLIVLHGKSYISYILKTCNLPYF